MRGGEPPDRSLTHLSFELLEVRKRLRNREGMAGPEFCIEHAVAEAVYCKETGRWPGEER